jgi:hypothetical protein
MQTGGGPGDIGRAGRDRLILTALRLACLTRRLEFLFIAGAYNLGDNNCPARTTFPSGGIAFRTAAPRLAACT